MKCILLLFLFLATGITISAQLPQKFNYQAIVRSNNGNIVANQPISIRFSIHDGTATGAIQFSETHSTTTNAFGLINLQVGTGTLVSGDMSAVTWLNGSKFLKIEIDVTGGTAFAELATVELIAVPYALHAGSTGGFTGNLAGDITGPQQATIISNNAVTTSKITDLNVTTAKIANAAITNIKLADGSVSTIKISNQSITSEKIADGSVTNAKIADNSITAGKINTAQVVKSLNGLHDNIQIAGSGGTTVDIAGNTVTIGSTAGTITGITAGAGLTGGGTTGNVSLAAALGGNGVANTLSRSDHTHVGQTWSTNTGTMLRLFDYDVNATPLNIVSYATGFSNAGISAQILTNTGQSVGVFGNTISTDGNAAGVFGQAYANGAAKGVWGLANGANTFGIFGTATGAGSWAGYFQGRVHVNGTLSKAAGSFRIDHPLDPANKTLSHSFVESPDMMNIYNGNVVLDGNGEAMITMPNYFESLNREFRYQLTAIGKPSPGIYVLEEIRGNRFRIAGGTPGAKISWMVTGIRQDPYAQQNPIVVEQQKQGSETGTYLFPEGYGQPAKSKIRPRVITVQEPVKEN